MLWIFTLVAIRHRRDDSSIAMRQNEFPDVVGSLDSRPPIGVGDKLRGDDRREVLILLDALGPKV